MLPHLANFLYYLLPLCTDSVREETGPPAVISAEAGLARELP